MASIKNKNHKEKCKQYKANGTREKNKRRNIEKQEAFTNKKRAKLAARIETLKNQLNVLASDKPDKE